jgi:hypothetical protein
MPGFCAFVLCPFQGPFDGTTTDPIWPDGTFKVKVFYRVFVSDDMSLICLFSFSQVGWGGGGGGRGYR